MPPWRKPAPPSQRIGINSPILPQPAGETLNGHKVVVRRGNAFALAAKIGAAEAMRRILIENARHKKRDKHGGGRRRVELPDLPAADDLLAIVLLLLDFHSPSARPSSPPLAPATRRSSGASRPCCTLHERPRKLRLRFRKCPRL
ncbi:MAG TPA: ECF-type sigma factor [Gemmataceae bacterium]|nr:ECF-type sigma factor [Gemmataceae bacterium]